MPATETSQHNNPQCDICKVEHLRNKGTGVADASYDGRTIGGPWAYMCERHFITQGIGIGLGRGQRLV